MDNYKVNQILYFKNQNQDIDSLIVYKKSLDYSPCNKLELSEYQYQEASIRMNDMNENDLAWSNRVQVDFTQKAKNEPSLKHFYVYGYSFNIRNIKKELKDTVLHLKYLNGEKVKCFEFDTKNSPQYEHSKSNLSKFYWSKERGLVKFIMGETLEYEIFQK